MEDKEILTYLREKFPHGHEDFIAMTLKELELHNNKNKDYAQGGDPLGNFNRNSEWLKLITQQYPNIDRDSPKMFAFYMLMKQLDAVLWMWNNGHKGEVEDEQTRLQDIHIYFKIIRVLCTEEAAEKEAMEMGYKTYNMTCDENFGKVIL